MKRLFTIACSVAMLTIFLPCHAQTQEPALARINDTKESPADQKNHNSATEPLGPLKSGSGTEEMAPNSNFILPATPDKRNSADWILKHKVGPSGEELMNEGGAYYYLDGKGAKIKVNPSSLEDNAKSS